VSPRRAVHSERRPSNPTAGSGSADRATRRAPPDGPAPTLAELRRLLRASAVFDTAQKRAWLGVLPHLAEAHRAELLAILRLEREPASPST
jgi:hypothetical protein